MSAKVVEVYIGDETLHPVFWDLCAERQSRYELIWHPPARLCFDLGEVLEKLHIADFMYDSKRSDYTAVGL